MQNGEWRTVACSFSVRGVFGATVVLFCKTALSSDRASVFCFGLITILLLLPVSSSQETSQQLTVPRMAGVFVPPVPGAPFSATVEFVTRQKLPDGSVYVLKTMNHIARDSAGRTRGEARHFVADAYKQEPPLTDIHIYDPATGLSTHLDPYAFIARQTALHAPPIADASSVPDPNPKELASWVKRVDDLGTRTFAGLTLHGTRQSKDSDHFNEFWYSPDLSIFMSRRQHDPVWDRTVTITQIDRQEPDPSNFSVPADYRVVAVKETLPAPNAFGIYHVGNGVSAPQLVYAADPKYTDEARRARYGGIAVVSLVVDAQGHPQNVQILRHLKMGLDEAAVEAVKQYKFKPATLEGKPVPVEVDMEVNFRIY
jgi:TonB family protein